MMLRHLKDAASAPVRVDQLPTLSAPYVHTPEKKQNIDGGKKEKICSVHTTEPQIN